MITERNKIFISYSQHDKRWLSSLQTHLKPYFSKNLHVIWADTAIQPGSFWETEIQASLNSARIAVLLVSPNFLASDFITNIELPRILDDAERNRVTVAWIAVSASAYRQTAIARYQCLNQPMSPLNSLADSDQQSELARIAEKLHALYVAGPATPNRTSALPVTASALTIDIDLWRQNLSLNPRQCVDRLLRGERLTEDDRLYTALELLVERSIESGLVVEAAIRSHSSAIRINSTTHLWTVLLGRVILDASNQGPLKWLIETTKQQLSAGPVDPSSLLMDVWRYLCQFDQTQSATSFAERAISAAVEEIKRNRDAFYPFVLFLYSLLERDTMATRVIGQHLQALVEKLGNKESPGFLTSLKRLVGRGLVAPGTAPLMPVLGQIEVTTLVPYRFEASVHPLTVYENSALRGIIPTNLKEEALYPFVFEIVSKSGQALLNKLASEVESILRILEDTFEHDGGHRWDVPTICEWLALAGCD